MGLAAVATGNQFGYLPPGPIFGMKITDPQGKMQKTSYQSEEKYSQPNNFLLDELKNSKNAKTSNQTNEAETQQQPENEEKEKATSESAVTPEKTKSVPENETTAESSCPHTNEVPSSALEMLSKLFPEKKKSVLELVLRRCGDDLLKAIEQCSPLREGFNYFGFDCSGSKKHEKINAEKMKAFQTGISVLYFRHL